MTNRIFALWDEPSEDDSRWANCSKGVLVWATPSGGELRRNGIVCRTRLGRHEILDAIGAGVMGEVYRARDTRLERAVAIEILPAHLSADPVRKRRFEREAKTISSLNHPHICTLYDVGQQDGVDFLVRECVEGETLSKRLEKGPLS